ncbi:cytochrome c biogenesis CcdA family protein [Tabrizicola oligotrophica]|uniref:Cytochrome c biogenesis protein CcdA n=1 Tax=Tabrizicola oligotrophica TaxID=2710650 RepID=A0A6M0QY32_9RHOB|nr:cytochrome c biogenesis protein CcdA [Tabrizicola oligotrophica]NEY91352.1 cytochrome c biogenesis protein CcdA [Tabrizicola oligotrophica]
MFGFDILDAGLILASVLAFTGGLLSFLSPCVLPVVPPYLAYMGGISMGEMTAEAGRASARRRVILPALFFVLGLSTVFLLLGFAASAFGRFFLSNLETFNRIAGAVVIVFGLHFLGLFRIRILDREARLDAGDQGGSALGAYVLGLAFAFGWTPCNGPILSGILTMAMQGNELSRTLYLMAVYALGLGLPFLLSAIFIAQAMGIMKRLRPHMRKIEIAMGLLLLVVGVTLFTGTFSVFSGWLLDALEALGLPLLG